MFIVLSVQGCFPSISIEIDEDGEVLLFATEKEAECFAKENCSWEYRIVEW